MNGKILSIEDAKKLENYDKLLENFNKLQGKYNEEHANNLNYQTIIKEREKNYLKSNREKDKRIKELEEKLSAYESKQIDIFGDN